MRAEWSSGVEDSPHYRSGVSLSWRTHEHFVVTLDLLSEWYQTGIAQTANHQRPDSAYVLDLKFSVGF